MPRKKTTKKTTKKADSKVTEETQEKEVIPSPLGASAPELSERAPEPVQKPEVVKAEQTKQPPYNDAFQAVCGIPGITAKQKGHVKDVMHRNWGKNKTVFIDAVAGIGGLQQKRKVIEKVLEKHL